MINSHRHFFRVQHEHTEEVSHVQVCVSEVLVLFLIACLPAVIEEVYIPRKFRGIAREKTKLLRLAPCEEGCGVRGVNLTVPYFESVLQCLKCAEMKIRSKTWPCGKIVQHLDEDKLETRNFRTNSTAWHLLLGTCEGVTRLPVGLMVMNTS